MALAAFSAEVSFSGKLLADVENNLDTSWDSHTSANQDLSLTTRVEFGEKTAVELYMASYSTVLDTTDSTRTPSIVRGAEPGRSAKFSDADSRWSGLLFDGIQFQWEFSRQAKFLIGDMTWSAGKTSYYGYNADEYGSIMGETTVRGLGFDLGGQGQIYLGAPDANNQALWGFAGYTFGMIDHTNEKLSIRLVGDLVFKNGGRNNRWTFGADGDYSRSYTLLDYGLHSAIGFIPYSNHMTYTFLVEPSIRYQKFTLGGTFYTALLADEDSLITEQTSIPEESFLYVEPGWIFHPKFSMGLGGEYHDPSSSIDDDEYFACTPTFYLYPSEEMTLTLWGQYRWNIGAHDFMSFGVEGAVEF